MDKLGHKCDVWDETFTEKSDLTQHLKTHAGAREVLACVTSVGRARPPKHRWTATSSSTATQTSRSLEGSHATLVQRRPFTALWDHAVPSEWLKHTQKAYCRHMFIRYHLKRKESMIDDKFYFTASVISLYTITLNNSQMDMCVSGILGVLCRPVEPPHGIAPCRRWSRPADVVLGPAADTATQPAGRGSLRKGGQRRQRRGLTWKYCRTRRSRRLLRYHRPSLHQTTGLRSSTSM